MTNLPRAGREYFHWTFNGLPDDHGPVEAFISGQWRPLTMDGAGGRILLAGPDADSAGAVVVSANQQVQLRVTDTPEVIIRDGGSIRLE
ncbi:hypothetical protein P5G50_18245 [Leifsonia sp. F6_8S_P_1B]|uniref:Uncharacterized protein n=1 Tax=Leifsonia williamsii TaxID=3035919 RepID=A0ABT8KGT7_9MICO|nr:hypothetical protein [Leifsonia williamsii]MDN4616392.1 hypothetical protein [Leifsonia williamsii]